jgi:hypothetical protein
MTSTHTIDIQPNAAVVGVDLLDASCKSAFEMMIREADLAILKALRHASYVHSVCKSDPFGEHWPAGCGGVYRQDMDGYRTHGNGKYNKQGKFKLFNIVELQILRSHD